MLNSPPRSPTLRPLPPPLTPPPPPPRPHSASHSDSHLAPPTCRRHVEKCPGSSSLPTGSLCLSGQRLRVGVKGQEVRVHSARTVATDRLYVLRAVPCALCLGPDILHLDRAAQLRACKFFIIIYFLFLVGYVSVTCLGSNEFFFDRLTRTALAATARTSHDRP